VRSHDAAAPKSRSSGKKPIDTILNGFDISANNLSDLLTTLEEHKGRHSTDTEFLGNVSLFVDVDLVELDLREVVAELFEYRGDGLAGTAPGCQAV
jgi:hypothetical protein